MFPTALLRIRCRTQSRSNPTVSEDRKCLFISFRFLNELLTEESTSNHAIDQWYSDVELNLYHISVFLWFYLVFNIIFWIPTIPPSVITSNNYILTTLPITISQFSYADRASKTEIPARSYSAPTVSSLIEFALASNKWGTTGNLKENVSTRIKKQMGVRFDKILRVVLIPARIDYAASNLTESLWWNEGDYFNLNSHLYLLQFCTIFNCPLFPLTLPSDTSLLILYLHLYRLLFYGTSLSLHILIPILPSL